MREQEHPLYSTWEGMNQRCNNPNSDAYPYYGGRGIKVCARWKSFRAFVEDMGPRPPGHTLDRKRPNEGYEPGNCRWATRLEQSWNQRVRHDNKTGIRGVFWFARTNRWAVSIRYAGKKLSLGYYPDFLDACCVRKSAEHRLWEGREPDEFIRALRESLAARPNKGNFKWRQAERTSAST